MRSKLNKTEERAWDVKIPVDGLELEGELNLPLAATGLVLFAHGSGSSRHSPRNQFVARALREEGLGTLLFDLLSSEEEEAEQYTRHLRFDIGLLARRLKAATEWVWERQEWQDLAVGFFGSSTGGAAALVTAADLGAKAGAVVSRGGRPDLAGSALGRVECPTLLIVGEQDDVVIGLNEEAFHQMHCHKELKIVPRATHLFEEPGALEEVALLAGEWFKRWLT